MKKLGLLSVILLCLLVCWCGNKNNEENMLSKQDIFENNLKCQELSWQLSQKYVEREYPYEIKEIFYSPIENECLAVLYNDFYGGSWYAYTIVSAFWEKQWYFSYNYEYLETAILSDFSWIKCYGEEEGCWIQNLDEMEDAFQKELNRLKGN